MFDFWNCACAEASSLLASLSPVLPLLSPVGNPANASVPVWVPLQVLALCWFNAQCPPIPFLCIVIPAKLYTTTVSQPPCLIRLLMAITLANSHAPSSATARPLERVSAADMSSPLLLKRLQQQKKKLAEAKAEAKKNSSQSMLERTQQWTGEQQPSDIITPKSTQHLSFRPGSSGKDNRRNRDIDRRIEGMGVREMDLVSLQKLISSLFRRLFLLHE